MKLYHYIGPASIADRAARNPLAGKPIRTIEDILSWAEESDQSLDADGCVIATFVVDESGTMRIADRRSEHVACAAGRRVMSAGEVTFAIRGDEVFVAEISNQSTGYCPEPESWPAVAKVLVESGLQSPQGFTTVCTFRLCPSCNKKNIVKDDVFVCGVCGGDLPIGYNCQSD
jgi:hypothetical protein